MSEFEEKDTVGHGKLVGMAAAVVALWALSGFAIHWFFPEWPDSGQFGDTFGAVNALFSGLAFAGLIYTILLQRSELSLQRKELQLTREEMSGQREQMESQASTLKLQQFENTFFQLVRTQGDITGAMILDLGHGRLMAGRLAFKAMYEQLRDREIASYGPQDSGLPTLRSAYNNLYVSHEAQIGHYFRHLYHIIKFIDESGIDEARRYTSFVRAQLSSFELQLLFYNCLSQQGDDNFKPLVEKYSLLKHLPAGDPPRRYWRFYRPKAFLPALPTPQDLGLIGALSPEAWSDETVQKNE